MEETDFKNFYKQILNQIDLIFTKKSGQFMLVGPDFTILDYAVSTLRKSQSYKFVEVKKDKEESPNGKVFVIRLSNVSSMDYQSLLYYYFELPLSYDCFICILTNSSNALNFFEKRVMSRFKNKIFFFPYYQIENGNTDVNNSLDTKVIHSSVLAQKQDILMNKYQLVPYSLSFILDLFEPLHLALIMISFSQRITTVKVFDQFKLAVINTPELKRATSIKVLQCLFDIMESGCVNEQGFPLIDFNEFKEFVMGNTQVYLKNLMRSIIQLKK